MPTFAAQNRQIGTMEATVIRKKRTREEVLAWLDAARQRKKAWEEETKQELKAIMDESCRAKESHYFDFAV